MAKLVFNVFTGTFDFTAGSSSGGDVAGPASSTDNAVARFDGITGKIIQNSGATIDDSGNITATNLSGTNTGNVALGTTNGLSLVGQTLSLGTSSSSTTGALTSTDWNTFNNKQDALGFTPEDSANKAQPNGYASLDGGGKIPAAQLPSAVMEFKGAWNATTNSPTLVDGTGDSGDIYRVSVAGTQDLGSGPLTFGVGDWVMYNGTIWQRSPATDAVISVNSLTGAVSLDTDDIPEGSALYFTNERAQDAVGGILVDTDTIDFTYDDSGNQITADVVIDSSSGLTSSVDGLAVNVGNGLNISNINQLQLEPASDNTVKGNKSGDIASPTDLTLSDLTETGSSILTISNGSKSIVSNSNLTIQVAQATSSTSGYLSSDDWNTFNSKLDASIGDLNVAGFSGANNQSSPVNVTGFAFPNITVRSFNAMVSVYVNATSSLYEEFVLNGIQKGSSWNMSAESTGDSSQVAFSITSSGQIQYTSANYSGFTALNIKFRALTTPI